MPGFETIGKILITIGVIFIALGLLVFLGTKIPLLGKIPGDIFIQKGNFTFFFPLVTCLLISVILTVVINVIFRIIGK
jgi:hypothetical protein